MDILEVFNTREQAFIVWGLIFLLLICADKRVRKDLQPVIVALSDKKFVVIYCLTILYTFGSAGLLKSIGLWDQALLKDTVVWMVFAAMPIIYKVGVGKDLKMYFRDTLKDLFQITLLLDFLIGLHTFSLIHCLPIGRFAELKKRSALRRRRHYKTIDLTDIEFTHFSPV